VNNIIKIRKIYTLGYEKMTADDFLNILQVNNIQIVVDVRDKPYSRNKNFSQKNLVECLKQAGIDYLHLQALGSSQYLRNKVRKDSDYNFFFSEYEKHLQNQHELLKLLHETLQKKAICLLCYEKDARLCHRRLIAERLASFVLKDDNCQVVHL